MERSQLPLLLAAALLSGPLASEQTSTPPAELPTPNIYTPAELGVLPPHAVLIGKSLGDWGGAWWQWALSFDKPFSPVADDTGKLCGLKQQRDADVWFLAGAYRSDPVVRECIVPEGKALFFPIINFVYYAPRTASSDCEEVTAAVKQRTQTPYNLYFSIDNKGLKDPYAHREASGNCFDPFALKKSSHNDAKSWAYPGASNGYWLALEPLPLGTHIIRFGGHLTRFSQDITYKIHVVRERQGQKIPTVSRKSNSI